MCLTGTFLYCWQGCKMERPPWKTWGIPLWGVYPREMNICSHKDKCNCSQPTKGKLTVPQLMNEYKQNVLNVPNKQHKRRLLCHGRTGTGSLELQDSVGQRCNAQERQIRGYRKQDSGCQALRETAAGNRPQGQIAQRKVWRDVYATLCIY